MAQRRRPARLLALAVSSAGLIAHAQAPLLHEYIEPNPSEDVELSATTQDGAMPAAIETESGVVPAPRAGVRDRKSKAEHAYGGNATPDSLDASFRVDRDTTKPDAVSYDEPFIPAVAPFKRLYAYDAVDESFELTVFDKTLNRLEIGGKAGPADDQFYADMSVDLVPGVPVRIPSVGPGARALVARADPELPFVLQRDRADNWFMLGDARRRVRLIMQLAAPRAAFGSELADASWGELVVKLPPLPPAVGRAASEVAEQLGVSRRLSPKQATTALVAYFRGFAPSEAAPRALRGAQLYQELALSRKGVCRHRAYAFVVTALGLGMPARMVRNEAHAWVEVYDGVRFHRIDLGGAAGRMELDPSTADHLHRPPPDAFAWPEGSESGQNMLSQTLEASAGSSPEPGAPSGSASAQKPSAPLAKPSSPEPGMPPPPEPDDERPRATVALSVGASSSARGGALQLTGRVDAAGEPCSHSRVDVSLRDAAGVETWLGAFPTDAAGQLEGRITVPFDINVGDYRVIARTPGTGRCGASH
ncbi:MAG TPA: transglutaminase domain-containing protein [Polyangiaceae bacterium]